MLGSVFWNQTVPNFEKRFQYIHLSGFFLAQNTVEVVPLCHAQILQIIEWLKKITIITLKAYFI